MKGRMETTNPPPPFLSGMFLLLFLFAGCTAVVIGIAAAALLFSIAPEVSDALAGWVLLVSVFSAWGYETCKATGP